MTERRNISIPIFDINKNKVFWSSVEDYIIQILAFDIQEHFHIEVLKAHAIMIRTYLIGKMKLFNGRGCNLHLEADVCNDPHHCMGSVYMESIEANKKEKLKKAVEETAYKVITFNDNLITPYYHNTCGGATENSENVLGNTLHYARKVLCDHCKSTSPHWQSSVDISLEELEELLGMKFPRFSPLQGPVIDNMIDKVERDEEGRVMHLQVGDKIIKGTYLQQKLGLSSTRFGWQPTGIKFYVQGKGHGIGLCQYGAQDLALHGKTAEAIIKYYFTGVEIEKIPQWSIKIPLQGKIILIDPGHGGKDLGISKNHVQEKDMNLKVSLFLEKILKEAGAEVVLTRSKDEYLSLGERLEINHKLHPHFMLSIHGDDNPSRKGTVSEIYVYPGDQEAYHLGKYILKELRAIGLEGREVLEADLYLTRESKNSTLVIDIGYFFIENEHTIEEIAQGIYKALLSYWRINDVEIKSI